MKILLTHELFPPDFAGGGEYLVLEMARGLVRTGVQVHVLTTGDPSITQYEGIPTTRLPISRYQLNLAVRRTALMARDVDIIQTCFYHACLPSLVAGKLLNKPVVCLVTGLFRDLWKLMRPPLIGGAWSAWEGFLLRRKFSRLMFLSDFSRHMALGLGIPAARTIVNCPGIDVEAYAPSPAKENIVFFTGKLNVRKGIYDLLAVARELPHVPFRVMGWGQELEQIKSISPGNIEFRKFERGRPLREAFASARIFFFPTRGETFGFALLEAMASGCAIVSSLPLEFEGIRVPAGDRAAMVRALKTLWDDHGQTASMGMHNVELAREYTWSNFISVLVKTYSEIMDGARVADGH